VATKREYSEEQKAEVMAALLAGQSVREVARQYNIPRGTIATWSASIDRKISTDSDTKKEIGNLIVGYLAESLNTLRIQVRAFADEEWLHKQPASEVAVLHGVIADKAIRLLEALAGDEPDDLATPTRPTDAGP